MRKYLIGVALTVFICSCQAQTNPACDSLKTKLFLANYKIEKVRYYLKIVKRKPSQKKYIVGWVTRAIE